jgi:uncharacterized membrane protein
VPISAPEWHPIAVHFPLALTVTAAFLLTAACVRRLARHGAALATVGTWNLCLGAIGAVVALGTGLAAMVSIHVDPTARAAVALHIKWAMFTAMALVLLAVWRGAGNASDAKPSRVFLIALWGVTAALIFTGYRGGQNVYRYGVAVRGGAIDRPHTATPRQEGATNHEQEPVHEP